MEKEIEALEIIGAEKLARGQLIRNDDKLEPYIAILKQALTEKQDLERFIRLVVEKNLVIAVIEFYAFNRNYEKNIALKVYNSTVNKEQELTQEEFDFIKEMIKKYGKRI